MSNTVLMVVDVQNRLINEHPYNEKKVVGNIKKLIEAARNNEKEVIYVRHDDGEGTELEKGTYGCKSMVKYHLIVMKRYLIRNLIVLL